MTTHDDINKTDLQRLVSSSVDEDEDDSSVKHRLGQDDSQDEELDPIANLILAKAYSLLREKGMERITIKNIDEELPEIGAAAIRNRLNIIVECKLLECIPGKGRRPSFYLLPGKYDFQQQIQEIKIAEKIAEEEDKNLQEVPEAEEKSSIEQPEQTESIRGITLSNEEILEKLESQHQKLKEDLIKLEDDIDAVKRTIALSSRFEE